MVSKLDILIAPWKKVVSHLLQVALIKVGEKEPTDTFEVNF